MKKGFTLIELLAVIIILAVIALIATPIILGIIDDTKKNAFKDSAYGISQAAKNAFIEIMYAGGEPKDITYTYANGIETSDPEGYTLNYEGDKPKNGQIILTKEGKVSLVLHDGKYCATKGLTDVEVMIAEKTLEECGLPEVQIVDNSGANAPVLATGMIPVMWDGNSWVKASNIDNPNSQNWYDYGEKTWANAITIDNTKTIDYSGNKYYGQIVGATQLSDGLSFDGVDDYILSPDSTKNYNFNDKVTFMARFQVNALGVKSIIMGNWEAGGGGIYVQTSNKIYFELHINGAYHQVISTSTVQQDTYYNVVGTYDGSNMNLYIDGVLNNSVAITGNVTTSPVAIGVAANPGPSSITEFSKCTISDIAIYTRPLNNTEVTNIYNNGNLPTNNLLLNYKLRQNESLPTNLPLDVNNMTSMWVWIPRYVYKISNGWHSTTGTMDIQFSQGTNDNWNSAVIGSINTGTGASTSNNNWTNHPAFTFGTTEVTGIWVAKFEPSVEDSTCYTTESIANCNKTDLLPRILPNRNSWRYIQVSNAFTVALNLEKKNMYGWGTSGVGIDTHMMTNKEWGAMAYLTQSSFGKNSEVWINNSSTYTTGCAGNSASEAEYTGCQNAYNTEIGVNASSTGNIYGIYDVSGGSWEYVPAYLNNGDGSLSTYGSNVLSANSKYKDIYNVGTSDTSSLNYDVTISKKGDAIYETSSTGEGSTAWNSDNSRMTTLTYTFLVRGGRTVNGSACGVFAFNYNTGVAVVHTSWRPVLVVGEGL